MKKQKVEEETKNLKVSKKLHKELFQIKLDRGFNSMEELVNAMYIIYCHEFERLKSKTKNL